MDRAHLDHISRAPARVHWVGVDLDLVCGYNDWHKCH